jgi:ABC-type Fe3+ transport system substrate-binding protein
MSGMTRHSIALSAALCAALLTAGCSLEDSLPDDERTRAADARVRSKWGKPLAELPTVTLVVISPHNENIRNEYEWAFSLHHAEQFGRKVRFDWRDVGGGSSTIRRYLENVYERADSAGIDILWGGGEFNFIPLADRGILEPMELPPDVLENVPATLGGLRLYDEEVRWIGSAVSAFGFLYNAGMLQRCGIAPPKRWEDLGDERFADVVALADPTQSGSAAAAYQMIARSGESWPAGWAALLRILSNAKRFTDSAGDAANAPVVGEALVAACIDFYGAIRVAEAPGELVYVSPRGQTTFSPDPIAILKNPPHPQLARRFVEFVMSARGQALWALRVGEADGPARSPLARQPIREDVYPAYRQGMLDSIVDPYEAGQTMALEGHRKAVDYDVLRQLVRAAAIDNVDGLRAARRKLVAAGYPAPLVEEFNRLPDNVATLEAMAATRKELKDETRRERTVTDWQRFFREKYARISGS